MWSTCGSTRNDTAGLVWCLQTVPGGLQSLFGQQQAPQQAAPFPHAAQAQYGGIDEATLLALLGQQKPQGLAAGALPPQPEPGVSLLQQVSLCVPRSCIQVQPRFDGETLERPQSCCLAVLCSLQPQSCTVEHQVRYWQQPSVHQ